MKPEYIQLVSTEERAEAMKLGAVVALARKGIRPSQIKSAAVALSPGGIAKTMITVSLLAGLPLGVVAHAMGRQITQQKNRERELRERIKFYRNAAGSLETGLAEAAPGV